MPHDYIHAIAFDREGNKWIGTLNGLVCFDDTSWTVYDTSNSGLPDNDVSAIAFDSGGTGWIGTGGGLVRFDGESWIVFDRYNSGLPSHNIQILAIDDNGNKWIGTDAGLAIFSGGNALSSVETVWNETNFPQGLFLGANYPNPFNPETVIPFAIEKSSWVRLIVYDLTGREIGVLLNAKCDRGRYQVAWKARNQASGIYFCRLETEYGNMIRKMTLLK